MVMDTKRATGCLVTPRKRSSLVLRDTGTENRDQNTQFCNRLGCNGRLNYTKNTKIGCSEKPESSSKSAFRSSNGKVVVGSSGSTCSSITDSRRKSFQSQKKQCNALETDISKSSSARGEPEGSERILSQGIIQNRRPRNFGDQGTLLGKSVPATSKKMCRGATNIANNANRYGLRTLKCNSISDVLPSGCLSSSSSSESQVSQRKNMVKKRNLERESSASSSASGRKTSRPSLEVGPISACGISISDSGQARNGDNGVTSFRSRRSVNGNTRTRLSSGGNGNNTSPTDSLNVTPRAARREMPSGGNGHSSSPRLSAQSSLSRSKSSYRPSSSGVNIPSMVPNSVGEHGNTRSSMNLDGLRGYNIAEVLLALERIEQDEQLLALETNLFLSLSFYDEHRDMRLDIDNMSYEELLALEETMGNVSTALSEEAVSKCLSKSIYQPIPQVEGTMGSNGAKDDTKCSICQEEYVVGDELGRLGCEHRYHGDCINQWLRLKNWCPICKASIESSPSSTSSSS